MRGEQGSGTVLTLAALGALVLALSGGLAVASAVHATHRARAGADLAALAAAAALGQGEPAPAACARAAEVAAANGVRLRECAAAGDLSVTVGTRAAVGWGLPGLPVGPARGQARAGPAP